MGLVAPAPVGKEVVGVNCSGAPLIDEPTLSQTVQARVLTKNSVKAAVANDPISADRSGNSERGQCLQREQGSHRHKSPAFSMGSRRPKHCPHQPLPLLGRQIVERGAHHELVARQGGEYAALWKKQTRAGKAAQTAD